MAGEKPKKRHIRWPCQRRWDPLRARWPARRPRCHGFEPQELVLVTKQLTSLSEREYWKLICDNFLVILQTLAFSSCVNNTRLANFFHLAKNAFLLILILLFLTKSHSIFWASSQAREATEAKEAIQKFWTWRPFRSLRTLETVSGSSPEWHQYMLGQLFNPFFQSKGFITTRESRRLFLCAIAFG